MNKRARARILPIIQLGQPVLRAQALAVRQVDHPGLQQFLDDMLATVRKAQGVGIAAPQVGVSCRAFWITPFPNPRYPRSPRLRPTAMINPRLLAHSKETLDDWEGCLSIPGIRGIVPRYQWVEIEYTARDGKRVRRRLTNFVARIFQHEFDHINGKVFVDRVKDARTFMTEAEYVAQRPYARRR